MLLTEKFHVEEFCFAGECPSVDVTISKSVDEMHSEYDKYEANTVLLPKTRFLVLS